MEVGIFGGTFDPPHVGHLVAAQDAMEVLGLDEVRFVPAHRSPFKGDAPEGTPAELRLAMTRAAVMGHSRFRVDASELERPAPSYTIDTVRAFQAVQPDVRWTLLLGADQWSAFDRWREAAELARRARVAVLTREGEAAAGGPDLPHREVPVTRIDISSSLVRARARAGRSIRYLVPDPVRALIEANGLYSTC